MPIPRIKFLVAAAISACMLTGGASAAPPITHCSNWMKAGPTRTALEMWLVGFMSGMSTVWTMQGLKPEDPGGRIKKNADLFHYVDSHCRLNADDDVSVIGLKLFKELASKN